MKNNIYIEDGHAVMDLYDKKGNIKASCIFDIEDIEKVSMRRWGLHSKGYVSSSGRRIDTKVLLHRYILPESTNQLDHINTNKLDNRKCNLRECNTSQNHMNMNTRRTNTSGCPGVYLRKDTGKWSVGIMVNYKQIRLGCFKDKDEAIKIRKEAELKYFKEFRRVI